MKRNVLFLVILIGMVNLSFAQTGIGNVNFTPQSILHTHINAASGNGLQITNTTTGNASSVVGFTINSNGNDYNLTNNQAGFLKFQTGNSYMSFQTNGAERMRILDNGNIGVGLTTTSYKFDVSGNIHTSGSAVFSGPYMNFGTTEGLTGYGFRDSAGVLLYKHMNSTWVKFSQPPTIPGNTEWWVRPTSALYIQPMANSNIRVYDAAQTHGLWYDGSSNQYAIYARTSSAAAITSAVTGFSDVAGNKTYGYLGYQGDYTYAGQTISGSAVYGMVEDPNRTAGFFRTTGNATVAANINYSDTWIANYNYVVNSRSDYNPSASYSQLDVSNASLGGIQTAIEGWSEYTAGSGNAGITNGGYFIAKGNTQGSYGVMGTAISTSGKNIGGYFAGATTTSSSYGVYGKSEKVADGIGVFGIGNNTIGYLPPNSAGAGGAFSGERYGVFSIQNSSTAATGYYYGKTYAGVIAKASITGDNLYHFGVHGVADASGNSNGKRSGGILGSFEDLDTYCAWGSLGYHASNGTYHAGYGTTAWTADLGKSLSNKTGVAFGGYGDLYGSWFRGEVYGMAVKGERYGLYVDGKQYTNDIITIVTPSASKSTKTATYVQTSMSVDVYAKGTGTLVNGQATVQFAPSFSELISSDEEVIVTITPIGRSANLYIDQSGTQGFVVKEGQNNTIGRATNIKFTWIAIGTKKGYENPQNPEEVMQKDYDKKLSGFMFNENDTQHSGQPMWWDGSKIRYDAVPTDHSNIVKDQKETQKVTNIKQIERPKPMNHKKGSHSSITQ